MRIEIRVDRSVPRRWHLALQGSLEARSPDMAVRFRLVATPIRLPGSVAALLGLERIVLFGGRPTLIDPIEIDERLLAGSDFRPDVVIDCTGGGRATEEGARVLRPLYDGDASEPGLVASLLAGRIPEIGLEDAATAAPIAWGRPSTEAAEGLTGALVAVVSRMSMLVEQAVFAASPPSAVVAPYRAAVRANRGVAAHLMRDLPRRCARAIYRLCFHSPHWRIGWRWHDGPGVAERGDLGGSPWQVLRDPGRRFFADPFPVSWQGRSFVFFEDLDHRVGKGVISAMEITPEGPRGGPVVVLDEPWHLSYPFVMEHNGALFMVPESSRSGAVALYRCIEFPHRWERTGTLVDRVEAADCTIFRHDDRWWMMGVVRPGVGGYSDMLAIYHAADPTGAWEEHDRRPVLIDVSAARPGGRVIRRGDTLLRPVQDCAQGYGRALCLARIDRLTTSDFAQTMLHRITPGPLWPGSRIHTLNRDGPLECIDGTTYNPKVHALRGLADARMAPARASTLVPSVQGGLARRSP